MDGLDLVPLVARIRAQLVYELVPVLASLQSLYVVLLLLAYLIFRLESLLVLEQLVL